MYIRRELRDERIEDNRPQTTDNGGVPTEQVRLE